MGIFKIARCVGAGKGNLRGNGRLGCKVIAVPDDESKNLIGTLRLVLLTLVGTLAYLGLAVLGRGGFVAFFSHPALDALALVLFALSGVSLERST